MKGPARKANPGDRCGNCQHFDKDERRCALHETTVRDVDWCREHAVKTEESE